MPSQTVTQENPAAGVVPAAAWRIQAISVLPNYRLAVTFRDGSTGIADFSAICSAANPGIYTPLADQDYFGLVKVELGAPTWPNGADIDPAWLHENLAIHNPWVIPF